PAQLLKVVVGAQQGVHVHIVGGVVAVVGVGLKDGVQVEVGHTQLMQVGQFELDALQVPAEIIVVQQAAGLVGLPGGFGVLVGLVKAVGKWDVLVLHPFAEAVGEDLVEHPALDRKSTRLNSSHVSISYAVFCLKKKKKITNR